jgi:predicted RNA binding protein YcfA (HicA-like mRNA interferase family)
LSLPLVGWRDILKALHKIGFVPIRQKGSHIIVQHMDGRFTVVPRHDPVDRGTLSGILEDVRLSKEEFIALLKKKR